MKKRIISIILSLTILFGCISSVSFIASANTTDDNSQQIEYEGGWNPSEYAVDGTTLYNDRVAISKTIAATDDENYFDITLEIVAKDFTIDQSVDVVVVMDNSNTMNATHQNVYQGQTGYNANDSRLNQAKDSIDIFIDKYSVNDKISEDRRFGLVTFNSYANTVIPLTTLNTKEQAEEIKTKVNAVTASSKDRERFTNIEGGLQLAYNLLKNSNAVYKYIIFVTDGFPTTYIESGKDSTTQIIGYDTFVTGNYNASRLNEDGYFADSVTGKVCNYGVDYSDKAADKADDVAATIKNDGINIFSIGIDVGAQSVDGYVDTFKNSPFTTVDRRSTQYVIGNTTESYEKWLRESIAGGTLLNEVDDHKYSSGNDNDTLHAAFDNILNDISLIPNETSRQAYTIDPMSDYVEFLNFYDKYNNTCDEIINETTQEDVATFDSETETITWWLKNTDNWYIDEHGNYVLFIVYRVRLKNEMEGFSYSTALETNDKTTFYFKTIDIESGNPLYGDNSLDATIPEVEGYYGDLTFTKVDSITREPISGAEFKLSHKGESCPVCNADAHITDRTATSDENGIVTFENLPSGHEYVLIETKAADGYQIGSHHTVVVSYGRTYIHGEEVSDSKPAYVTNQKLIPATLDLSVNKTLVDGDLVGNEFVFVLDGQRPNGIEYQERIHNDSNGEATFDTIIFEQEGNYVFNIFEEKGKDDSIIYDDTTYKIECTITLNSEGTGYVIETKVNGKKIDNDSKPDTFEFVNKRRNSAKVTLEATKYFDGKTPNNDQFYFALIDQKGDVVETVTNTGLSVKFKELEFSHTGNYIYTIKEVHGNDANIHYDHTVYTAKITVTAPENSDSFDAQVVYMKDNAIISDVSFENKTRIPSNLKIYANKTLDGNIPNEQTFGFQLKDDKGKVLQTTYNNDNGIIEFDEIALSQPGIYTYYINEIIKTNDNFTYDKTVYEVLMKVESQHTIDGYYMELYVLKLVGDDTEVVKFYYGTDITIAADNTILFENNSRQNVKVNLTAEKTLNGVAPGENDIFEFALKDAEGNVLQTVNNDGKYIEFDELIFNTCGTYEFTVEEVEGDDDAIKYDNTVYTVIITVTAPEDSDSLAAQVLIDDSIDSTITFANETIIPIDVDYHRDPEPTEIDEDKVPQTSDESNLFVWCMLIVLCVITISVLTLGKKSKSNRK